MESDNSRRVQILRDSVASKIAAGEVIDRPFSILRELLDNSLDAGALNIEVRLKEGGIRSLEVRDDGNGMTKEDLQLCWLPHATSKITHEDDLQKLHTLGFRGEALSAVTACARLTIETGKKGSPVGYRLEVDHLHQPKITEIPLTLGTRVRSEDLFYSIPARRRFLKSSGAETLACQRTLEEKALAFPHVTFKLHVEDKIKLLLPAEPQIKRLYRIFERELAVGMMEEVKIPGDGFSIYALTSRPGLHRSDRKLIHIYANERKIQEYAFVQAVCYAYGEYLPGGMLPCSFIFLTVDPDLVDFNIHPAKKEARFRNQQKIHSRLVEGLRKNLEAQRIRSPLIQDSPQQTGLFDGALHPGPHREVYSHSPSPSPREYGTASGVETPHNFFQAYQRAVTSAQAVGEPESNSGEFKYLGQIMGVFLLVDWGNRFFLVDQHAAHERILFEEYLANSGRPLNLLIPLNFSLDPEKSELLHERKSELEALGIRWEEGPSGEFKLLSIPEKCQSLEGEILGFLVSQQGSLADLKRDLYARMSCRAAVMDGDRLEPRDAQELLEKAFLLQDARCPHGRPVWVEFTKTDLYRMFGRIV